MQVTTVGLTRQVPSGLQRKSRPKTAYPRRVPGTSFSRSHAGTLGVPAEALCRTRSLCYTFRACSGVVQSVARGPLEPEILVRVQAPEPILTFLRTWLKLFQFKDFHLELRAMNDHPFQNAL
jgi:hypothetical protein